MELLAISLGLWAGLLFLVALHTVFSFLFWLFKPIIDEYDDKKWEEFRQDYYKRNCRYPVIRHVTM